MKRTKYVSPCIEVTLFETPVYLNALTASNVVTGENGFQGVVDGWGDPWDDVPIEGGNG